MASLLKSLLPVKEQPGTYVGDAQILGTLNVPKPEAAARIIGVKDVTLKTASGAAVLNCMDITAVVAADGQSVMLYGWKPTAVNDVTPIASTTDADFTFVLICDQYSA